MYTGVLHLYKETVFLHSSWITFVVCEMKFLDRRRMMGLLLNEFAFSCQLHLALPPVCTSQILYPAAIVNVVLYYICFSSTSSLYFIHMAKGVLHNFFLCMPY